jgi:preprotein translocase subunit SecE
MASVMKNQDGNDAMADEEAVDESGGVEEERKRLPAGKAQPLEYKASGTASATSGGGPGFFTIYKKGQGYWTRIGTVAGAALLALLSSQFLYSQGRVWFQHPNGRPNMPVVLGVVAAFLVIFAIIVFRIINRPTVVDFLIATDSEMKKVNWTTRAELIGSTKVVIFFMILIAILLFTFDTVFGYLFWLIDVLKFKPL